MPVSGFFIGFILFGTPTMAPASEPDTWLIEYQAFSPDRFFSVDDGPDQAMFTAVQSEKAWRALWSEIEPKLSRNMEQVAPHPFPPIDFARYTLLVAALGTKPSSGFRVAIESVQNFPSRILVSIIALRPGRNCPVFTAITHPVALALIPKTSKPVTFEKSNAELACD